MGTVWVGVGCLLLGAVMGILLIALVSGGGHDDEE